MLRHQGAIRSDLLNRGTGRVHHIGFNFPVNQNSVQAVCNSTPNFQVQSYPNAYALPCHPTQQQLDFYKGWNTANLVRWMRDLGYGVTLNVPKSLLSVKLETGTINFSFSPESAMINQVQFTPETSGNL